jgi:ornithine--oxo-acid transaminase
VKLARKWGYKVKSIRPEKARIIVCEGNFHGRTTTIVSFSTEPQYRDGFGPFTPGFDFIPYGSAEALERAITPETVGFLVEPIQGEAGIVIPPKGYLADAARICKANNVLLLNDEIQTGLGRTGTMFAGDHEGVRGDVMIIGKALGGGVYPISAVLASETVMGVFQPGDHGSTFGGNPLACAVAREALAVLVDEKLAERSARLGDYLLEKLRRIGSPKVKEVRGRGLFVGVELKKEAGPARPACEALMRLGVLAKETHDQVIRLAPPLVVDEPTLDFAVEKVAEVLKV